MATTTRILDANVNGTVYTSNANAALEALDTCHSGATAPTDEVANGKLWLDTTTTPGILKIYNNATWEVVHSGTVDINAGTIDGTTIGATTPAAITGTTLTSTGAITGTTLTATGAFTSLGIDDNAAATAVTIDASGNVGIGTASPSSEISGSATVVEVLDGNLAGLRLNHTGGASYEIYSGGSSQLGFVKNGTEAMRIDGSGNVLVGATSTLNGNHLFVQSNNFVVGINGTNTTGEAVRFYSNGTTVGTISYTGSATAYNTSSDYRLKENIAPVQGASDIVKAMQPVTYTFKSDGSWHDGFLAHELQELHPRAVTGKKDAMRDEEYEVTPAVLDEDGAVVTEAVMGTRSVPDYQGVDYSKLTPILTAALQEALNKIDALEARLTALEVTP